ncbi:hypothetical protein [Sphingomonas sp. 3-13AW]|uniref:hypothetical protein n=1 Tax=Sphingomonas sp. 3-13AW TaxID=3050450 RepID=UPI003BB673F1
MAQGQNAAKNGHFREYWSRRPCGASSWGKATKIVCHRLERRRFGVALAREVRDLTCLGLDSAY